MTTLASIEPYKEKIEEIVSLLKTKGIWNPVIEGEYAILAVAMALCESYGKGDAWASQVARDFIIENWDTINKLLNKHYWKRSRIDWMAVCIDCWMLYDRLTGARER